MESQNINNNIYIKELRVKNYKSFKGEHIFKVWKNKTSIIGPNGSGKSNIIDAISFLLNNPLENINLSEKKNKSSKEESLAELTYIYDDIEVKFKKIIKNKDKLIYYVDDKKTDEQSYISKLKDFKLNGVNILRQNHYNIFTNKSPKELTEIFEVLSGSKNYKIQYDETLKNLKEYKFKNYELSNKIKDINTKLNFNKKIVKSNQNYGDKKLKYDNTVENKYIFNIYTLLLQREYYTEQITNLESEKFDLKTIVDKLNYELLKKDLEQKNYESLKNEKNKIENKIVNFNNNIDHLNNNLKDIAKEIGNFNIFKESLDSIRNEKLNKEKEAITQIEELQKKIKNIKKNKKNLPKDLSTNSNFLEFSINSKKYNEFIKNRQELINKNYILKEELDKKDKETKDLDSKFNTHIENNNKLISNNDELDLNNTKLLNNNKELEVNIDKNYNNLYENIENDILKKKSLIKELQGKIKSKTNNELILNQLYEMYDGYLGRVEDVIKSKNIKYDKYIEMALENSLNYLLVDNDETAIKVNIFLKDNGLKRNVIIIKNLQNLKLNLMDLRNKISSNATLIFDLIEIINVKNSIKDNEKKIETALKFLLNGKIYCNSRQNYDALKYLLNDKSKTIIFNDKIFNRSSITHWRKDEFKKDFQIKGIENQIKNKINLINQDIEKLELKKVNIKDKDPKIIYNKNLKEIDKNNNLKFQNSKLIEKNKGEIDTLKSNILNINEFIIKNNNLYNQNLSNIENLEENINNYETLNQNYLNILTNQTKYSVDDLLFITNNTINKDSEINNLEEEILNFKSIISNLKIDDLDLKIIENNQKINNKNSKIININDHIKMYTKNIKQLKNESKKYDKILVDNINSYEIDISDKKNALNTININLKKFKSHINRIKLNLKELKEEILIKGINIDTNGNDIYKNSVNFLNNFNEKIDEIKNNYKFKIDNQDNNEIIITKLEEIVKKIYKEAEELKKDIEYLSIDIKFSNKDNENLIENLEKEKKMYQAEITSNLEENDKIEEKLDEIKNLRRETFMLFFNSLNSFCQINFKLNSDNDGNYYSINMKLENTYEPYLSGVYLNVNTKDTHNFNIENLSSGQLTIINLVLFLSIININKNKIIILDEIEAHLDNSKIDTFNDILKNFKFQKILISHKKKVYQNSDSIIGVTTFNGNSEFFTLNPSIAVN